MPFLRPTMTCFTADLVWPDVDRAHPVDHRQEHQRAQDQVEAPATRRTEDALAGGAQVDGDAGIGHGGSLLSGANSIRGMLDGRRQLVHRRGRGEWLVQLAMDLGGAEVVDDGAECTAVSSLEQPHLGIGNEGAASRKPKASRSQVVGMGMKGVRTRNRPSAKPAAA